MCHYPTLPNVLQCKLNDTPVLASESVTNTQTICQGRQLLVFRGCYYAFSSADQVSKTHVPLPDMAWQMPISVRTEKRSYLFLKVPLFHSLSTMPTPRPGTSDSS